MSMIINGDTKIAALLKANPDALEAIIGISPGFKKLRNPVLRKILAAKNTGGKNQYRYGVKNRRVQH